MAHRALPAVETKICDAIRDHKLVEFDYSGVHRVVQPYCHGFTRKGQETLRAVQVGGGPGPHGFGFGKLWTVSKIENLRLAEQPFAPDDPRYNPDDSAMVEIHCRV